MDKIQIHTTITEITKLLITCSERLDPINVYLEQVSPSAGRITINCGEKSWTAYWGGMGGRTIAEFFLSQHDEYLVMNLDSNIDKYEPDYETFAKEMRQKICEMRRDDVVSADLARAIFDVEDWSECLTGNPYEPVNLPEYLDRSEIEDLDFFGFDVPERITFEYRYLTLIINTVKEGLKAASISKKGAFNG